MRLSIGACLAGLTGRRIVRLVSKVKELQRCVSRVSMLAFPLINYHARDCSHSLVVEVFACSALGVDVSRELPGEGLKAFRSRTLTKGLGDGGYKAEACPLPTSLVSFSSFTQTPTTALSTSGTLFSPLPRISSFPKFHRSPDYCSQGLDWRGAISADPSSHDISIR